MSNWKSRDTLTAHQRIYNLLHGKPIDRLPAIEWAPFWNQTIDRWCDEGLGLGKGCLEIQEYFGLDKSLQTFYPVRTAQTPLPPHHGAGIAQTREAYHRIKSTMFPDVTKIYTKENYDWLKKMRNEGDTILWFTVEGFFWFPRETFGIEPHLYSFYDESSLLQEMCNDYADWLCELLNYIGNTFSFDFMSFAEDMSYNNGPMISKQLFDEFLAPYYKKVIPLIKKMNTPVFIDSDGDITKAVDWYAKVGADGMFPLERQAGVDVSLYLEKQPEMFFLGHFDKMCMKFGKEAMVKEFERLLPSMKTGRFIPSVDHQTPPDVSIKNYKIYVELLKEYTQKAF